jgi:hypothetical protein
MLGIQNLSCYESNFNNEDILRTWFHKLAHVVSDHPWDW